MMRECSKYIEAAVRIRAEVGGACLGYDCVLECGHKLFMQYLTDQVICAECLTAWVMREQAENPKTEGRV
jgi:hypothetical protein